MPRANGSTLPPSVHQEALLVNRLADFISNGITNLRVIREKCGHGLANGMQQSLQGGVQSQSQGRRRLLVNAFRPTISLPEVSVAPFISRHCDNIRGTEQ